LKPILNDEQSDIGRMRFLRLRFIGYGRKISAFTVLVRSGGNSTLMLLAAP
jgi:hypothetical protein